MPPLCSPSYLRLPYVYPPSPHCSSLPAHYAPGPLSVRPSSVYLDPSPTVIPIFGGFCTLARSVHLCCRRPRVQAPFPFVSLGSPGPISLLGTQGVGSCSSLVGIPFWFVFLFFLGGCTSRIPSLASRTPILSGSVRPPPHLPPHNSPMSHSWSLDPSFALLPPVPRPCLGPRLPFLAVCLLRLTTLGHRYIIDQRPQPV